MEQLTSSKGPCPRPPTKASIVPTAQDERVVVRITAPECYRSFHSKDAKEDSPTRIVADIASWKVLETNMSALTGGTWKKQWARKGAETVGHLLLRKVQAKQLLQYSGKKGIFTQTGDRSEQLPVRWVFARERGK